MPVLPPSGGQLTASEVAGIRVAGITAENPPATLEDIPEAQLTEDEVAGIQTAGISEEDPPAKVSQIPESLVIKPASQAAATFNTISSARSKLWLNYMPRIEFPVGIYTAADLDLTNIYSPITIVGDQRPLAGLSWQHSIPVYSTATGAGTGNVTLSSDGYTITITCATTNPDLTGWVAGDKVIIINTSGTVAIYTIDSVAGNVITLTTAAPTVNALGASITLIPNRSISEQLIFAIDNNVTLQGFYFDSIPDHETIINDGKLAVENTVIYGSTFVGITNERTGILTTGPEVSIIQNTYGIYGYDNSSTICDGSSLMASSDICGRVHNGWFALNNARILWGAGAGLRPDQGAKIECEGCYIYKSVRGVDCEQGSKADICISTFQYNTSNRFISAQNSILAYTGGTYIGNGKDYITTNGQIIHY